MACAVGESGGVAAALATAPAYLRATGAQTDVLVVGKGDNVLIRLKREQCCHRTKGLIAIDQSIARYVTQNGWLKEQVTHCVPLATAQQACTFGHSVLDMLDLFGDGIGIHQGANIRIIQTTPYRQCFGCGDKFVGKFVIDRALDIEAVGTKAVLT